MRIYRICRALHAASAFSGEGARLFGGRWNSRGVPMVYASSSLALAAIELFVHIEPSQLPEDLVSIAAELAFDPERSPLPQLPTAWWSETALPQTRALGDAWIRSAESLAIRVPSVPIRSEWNVLLNPIHREINTLRIEEPQPFAFDARMFKEQA